MDHPPTACLRHCEVSTPDIGSPRRRRKVKLMSPRYQIFLSSTFVDLAEERQKVSRAILEMGHFPSGMELFPAVNEEQFNFIKTVIDDCDYYVLIVGGRYGSMTDEGISYTEMEYDYAKSKSKPILSFLHKDIGELPGKKIDLDNLARSKLVAFKTKVSDRALVKFWEGASELAGEVVMSLNHAIRQEPQVGWVRADTDQDPALIRKISEQEKILSEFRRSTYALKQELNDAVSAIDAEIVFKVHGQDGPSMIKISGLNILRHFAPLLYDGLAEADIKKQVNEFIQYYTNDFGSEASDNSIKELLFYLEVFEFIDCEVDSDFYGPKVFRLSKKKIGMLKNIFKAISKTQNSRLSDEIPF